MEFTEDALVIRTANYGESDRMITLVSAGRGKFGAAMKGVRKAGAKLNFAAQPFCFAEYVLSQKGDRFTVINAAECESFYDLRTDINKFYAACSAAEAANALTYEGDECREIFYALVKALSDMCIAGGNQPLIAFLLDVLKKSGYGISAENCAACGKPLAGENSLRFDLDAGAFTCGECAGTGASRVTYNVIRKAEGKPFERDFITADGEKRALRLLREYFSHKLNFAFKSLSEYIRLI